MATVYAATHRNGKRVAVKMLHSELSANQEVRARFLREGYAANAVEHRGVVMVDDDDVTEDGAAFLVMELLDGETIETRRARKGGRLPAAEVLSLVDQLLDVLAAAHDKGIVHRDIKPENLFLTREGTLKVLDFGIARLRDGTVNGPGTRMGSIMGTPAFMAQEQALARWDLVDGRTDLWAVGATMWTLLSGRFVREGATVNEDLAHAITKPAPSIVTVVPQLPPRVVDLVDRAMAHEKEQRWSSAHAMREALHAAISGAGERVPVSIPGGLHMEPASAGTIAPGTTTIGATPSAAARRPWAGVAVALGLAAIAVAVWATRARTPPIAAAIGADPTSGTVIAGAVTVTPSAALSTTPTARAISIADLPDVTPGAASKAPRPRGTAVPTASAVPPRAPPPAPPASAPPAPPPPPPPAPPPPAPARTAASPSDLFPSRR
jgi:serine/threonine-protein kinase